MPWLLVIDEAAEILDVKPKDKIEKELHAEIDSSLRTLARISRAAGVHTLLGIIRPDSNILDGQIKNNLLWRACGYFADSAPTLCEARCLKSRRIVLPSTNVAIK